MVTVVKPVQSRNAFLPIDVMALGRVTAVKPVQSRNAPVPIFVTVYCFPLYVTVEGMTMLPEYFPELLYVTLTSSSSSFV